MPHLLAPIVGAHFHPPAKLILQILPLNQSLILDPEPDNPYDPDAIKVMVKPTSIKIPEAQAEKIADELISYGSNWEDVMEKDLLHIGYIPKSGAKTARVDGQASPGNIEFLDAMSQPNWKASLTFSAMGQPFVRLSYQKD